MSLDVYLRMSGQNHAENGSGIFVRENGARREISRAEWDDKFPGQEPVTLVNRSETDEVYWRNITHNLNRMAGEANIYKHLWRPDEIGITTAVQLIEPLEAGLALLQSEPDRFREFNPPNGWGTYEGLVDFVADYLNACKEHPDATVEVSR